MAAPNFLSFPCYHSFSFFLFFQLCDLLTRETSISQLEMVSRSTKSISCIKTQGPLAHC